MTNRKRESRNRNDIYNSIEQIFRSNPMRSYTVNSIIKQVTRRDKRSNKIEIVKTVKLLVEKNILEQPRSGEFKLNTSGLDIIVGEVVTITPTAGYVSVVGMDNDVLIERSDMSNALIGDKVEMMVFEGRRSDRVKGIIKKIVERSTKRYVGIIDISDNYAFVKSNSRNMQYDIFIPKKDIANAANGDMVVAEIVEFSQNQPNPVGKVLKSLGLAGTNDAEMHAILEEFSLPYEFPEAVIKASDMISDKITEKEISKRRDMRDTITFTIDPFDAKDFDDALSLKKLDDNKWEVGIHIADVTHYITEHTVLESNAQERATSVYLVDRVVPMLPERLSNGLCSLRPNEDKLSFSVVLTMDNEANIVDKWYGRTVINSNRRFSYDDAQAVIEGGDDELKDEILTLHSMALILRKNRYKNGSIAFERDEFKFKLDENNKPIGVYLKAQKDSNHLIEEFMLLANKAVAEFVALSSKPKRTFVYRVHTEPNNEKYISLCKFVGKFGFDIKITSDQKVIAQELNRLLGEVKGQKSETLISTLALRAMAKAVYTTTNVGHYGLGFDNYTHFTSPIRRYPDMMVHRLLQHYLDGGASKSQEIFEELCDHSSKREQRAAEAERASTKYKMAEFIADKIGLEFIGSISGVTEKGIYVELDENKIEGMVSVHSLKDDMYQFDQDNYRLVGRHNKVKLMLGDKVKVEVLRVDMQRKLIDFTLVSHFDYDTDEEFFFD